MKNHERLISRAREPEKRRTITVSLLPETVKRLDALARRSERSRSNLIARMLDCALLIIACSDPEEI